MEELSLEKIREGLDTRFIGREVVSLPTVGSTNEVAKALATRGAPQGTLVVAEEQTAGKGRMGRRWIAPAGTSLLFSLLLYPSLSPGRIPRLTMLASLAAAEAIESLTGLPVRFKWPNDIFLRGRKMGGVLTEVGLTGERVDYAVVGVGLNVNWDPSPVLELEGKATSISQEWGREASRLQLLRRFLASFEEGYLRLQEGYSPSEVWGSRLASLGQEAEVALPGRVERGQVEGVDEDGALLLRQGKRVVRVTMGEVR